MSRKIRPYKGKVSDPKLMTTQSIKAYLRWCEEYLEWCLDSDGRVSAYDRMANTMSPYHEELEKRLARAEGRGD